MTAVHALKIADQGERTGAFRRARVNSAFVRLMRWILPVGAVLLLSTYALFMQRTISIENDQVAGKIDTGTVSMSSVDNLAMANPSFEGYIKKDGSRYRVSAKKAITDLSRDKPIELLEIDGAFEQANGDKTQVKATRGVFDQKLGTLNLAEGISVDAPNGLSVALNSAVVDTKTAEIVSNGPVQVRLPQVEVHSNGMRLNQRQREVLLRDGVSATLQPTARKGKNDATAAAPKSDAGSVLSFGGGSQSPVKITSATLAIAEKTRTAQFKGNVRATQDGRTLEAPVLDVLFAGGTSVASLGGPGEAADGGRLQKIVASDGVKLNQGGNIVQARMATFDVTTDKIELQGNVKISAPAQRSIKADQATISTISRQVVLTGNVVAVQARSVLRGNQLVYEPGEGRMKLASPAVAGAPRGNIFVRFVPPPAKSKRRKSRGQPARGGLAFSTNPDAPIEIVARSLDVRDPKSVARFDGGVRVRQGDFLLKTPVMTAHYDGQLGLFQEQGANSRTKKQPMKMRFIRATGPVEITSGDDTKATSQHAEFNMVANIVTITGNVVLTQGRQIVRGERAVIDLKTGITTMKKAAPGKVAAKPLTFGAAPKITANPNERQCGGKMCLVFFPRDAQAQQAARKKNKGATARRRPAGRSAGRQPKVGSGWSTSTNTN